MVSIYVQMSSVVAVSLLDCLLTGEEHGEHTRFMSISAASSAEHVRMLCPVSPHTAHFRMVFFLVSTDAAIF